MKHLFIISFSAFTISCYAQDGCQYNKPKKFDDYISEIKSEFSGLHLNGYNLHRKQIQFEFNSILGSLPKSNSYGKMIFAGFIQVRYGITSKTEFQVGTSYINVAEANPDSLYKQKHIAGFKQRIFTLKGQNISWNFAISPKYLFQQSWIENQPDRNGYSFTGNSSWSFFNTVYLDLAVGTYYFPQQEIFHPIVSSFLLLKDQFSKTGIFVGIEGNYYTENFCTVGIQKTDNYNYIFQFSVGFFDKAIVPNISYTHAINIKTRKAPRKKKR